MRTLSPEITCFFFLNSKMLLKDNRQYLVVHLSGHHLTVTHATRGHLTRCHPWRGHHTRRGHVGWLSWHVHHAAPLVHLSHSLQTMSIKAVTTAQRFIPVDYNKCYKYKGIMINTNVCILQACLQPRPQPWRPTSCSRSILTSEASSSPSYDRARHKCLSFWR